MPIKIPDDLPAAPILRQEGVEVMRAADAVRQDIRPMRIAILNLMPEKAKTETQLARVLGRTPLQVEISLLTTSSYRPTNTPHDHMRAFYQDWADVRQHRYDGLIITGAPIERLEFEEVIYWDEVREILDWADHNVFGCYFLCWAAQAALYHHHGIPKYELPAKLSGVYPHRLRNETSPLVAGFDDNFNIPVSRWTEVRMDDVARHDDLVVLADSEESGLALMQNRSGRKIFMFNHLEYDTGTLNDEFLRDSKAEDNARVPAHYYPGDDPLAAPPNTWRGHGQLLYGNWVNMLYQGSPYDLAELTPDLRPAKADAAE